MDEREHENRDHVSRKEFNQLQALVKDNNELLRKMHRAAIFKRIMMLLYLAIIIGGMIVAYYFIQPYLEGALGFAQNTSGGSGALIQELLQ